MTPVLEFVSGLNSLTAYALALIPLAGIGYWAVRKPNRTGRRPR